MVPARPSLSAAALYRNRVLISSPRVFSRCKSIRAAIERGRQGDEPFQSRRSVRRAPSSSRRDDSFGGRSEHKRDDAFGSRTENRRDDSFAPRRSGFRNRETGSREAKPWERDNANRETKPWDRDNASREIKPWDRDNASREAKPWERDTSRPERRSRDDRGEGEGYARRDVRPRDGDRESYGSRDTKPRDRESFGNRDSRPRDRESFGNRDTRPWHRDSGRDTRPRDRDAGRDGRSTLRYGDRQNLRPAEIRRDGSQRSSRDALGFKPASAYIPDKLPYTTAASEFLYGTSSVLAALRARSRKLYKLYIHARGLQNEDSDKVMQAAHKAGVTYNMVGDEYLPLMDKASAGRPHNGFILEASPLPQPLITHLGPVSRYTPTTPSTFAVALAPQSREDKSVNGTETEFTYDASSHSQSSPASFPTKGPSSSTSTSKQHWRRYPLALYVDGVLDEGNLGAIARSAYFLGVDALITPTRQSAPWSHIAVKASAGAAEALRIFRTEKPGAFLKESKAKGWRVYASAAITENVEAGKEDGQEKGKGKGKAASSVEEDLEVEELEVALEAEKAGTEAEQADHTDQVDQTANGSGILFARTKNLKSRPALLSPSHSPLSEGPTILMMGAEGEGLRASLISQASYKVGIRGVREVNELGVDSLNVSVAASLLCYEFLNRRGLPGAKIEMEKRKGKEKGVEKGMETEKEGVEGNVEGKVETIEEKEVVEETVAGGEPVEEVVGVIEEVEETTAEEIAAEEAKEESAEEQGKKDSTEEQEKKECIEEQDRPKEATKDDNKLF